MSKNKTRVAINAVAGKANTKEKVSSGQASVGIDFGTTKISIAAYKPDIGVFDIIVNEDGERATPCYVGFTNTERVIGTPAKTAVSRNVENTIHSFRDALNSSFGALPAAQKSYGVSVRPDENDRTVYEVKFKAEATMVTPDELIQALFERVKAHADGYWDEDVKNLVLSVPSTFSAEAREAMTACANKAGFAVTAVLAEPLAAAISFGLDDETAADAAMKKNILVVDVGSYSTTFSVLSSQHGLLSLIDTDCTQEIGATHVDAQLFTHFSKVFTTKFQLDLSESKRATTRLLQACEGVKKSLSSMPAASVKLDSLFEGQDLFADVTRARMEMMCDSLFRSLHNALVAFFKRPHNVRASAITHIVLAGGGAALPRTQAVIENFFAEQTGAFTATVLKQTHPSEAAVFGCAKQASLLAGVPAARMADTCAAARALKAKIDASGVVAVSTADANKPVFATVHNEAYAAPVFALAKALVAKSASGAFVPVLPAGTPVPCSVTLPFAAAGAAALALYEQQSATEFAPVASAALPAPAAAGAPLQVRVAVDAHHKLTVSVAAVAADRKPRANEFKTVITSALNNELLSAGAAAATTGAVEKAPFAAQQTVAAQITAFAEQWGKWKAANGAAAFLKAASAEADAKVSAAVATASAAADKLPALAALNASLAEVQEAVAAVVILFKKGPEVAAAEAAAAARAAAAAKRAAASPDSDDDEDEDEDEDDDDEEMMDIGGGDLD